MAAAVQGEFCLELLQALLGLHTLLPLGQGEVGGQLGPTGKPRQHFPSQQMGEGVAERPLAAPVKTAALAVVVAILALETPGVQGRQAKEMTAAMVLMYSAPRMQQVVAVVQVPLAKMGNQLLAVRAVRAYLPQ